ncbi:DNA-binding MarR family transcriptional regulator [Amaricoccus macauensis]|uniref:DNA-binding MarR family transcriptional regulator n=1 Tax=Amaricoccus macauensis TaxID=57001 RepID=A0A840SPK3_9RHOB|nr:MarR family transcriptional regulator [Amaricoccus macauensis]MBB5222328.1 DNA-binding MarR family transcriptional regulator [Amaricoccus macauensis]
MTMIERPEVDLALSKARLRLWLRLLGVARLVESELRERLRGLESTLPRFDVMAALHRAPDGLKMTELSSVLRVSNGNVTGIVDRLEQEGLATRTPVEGDRRALLVRLTPAGVESFAVLAAHHEAWVNELLGDVTREEADHLNEQLQVVRHHLMHPETKA